MKTHVFLGAGPANLHRALKIAQNSPGDRIIIVEPRLDPATLNFDRKAARPSIFFFDSETYVSIKRLLSNSGVHVDSLVSSRRFGINKSVSGSFFMIQIRDLQILLMDALKNLFYSQRDQFIVIKDRINVNGNIRKNVMDFLKEKNIKTEDSDKIEIHLATGALKDAQQAIIYPVQTKLPHREASSDVKEITIVPKHGIANFHFERIGITTDELSKNLVALERNPIWKSRLKQFNWGLLRPPSVRIFYAADILYIGAEIPYDLPEEETRHYLKTLLELSFPGLPIFKLDANQEQVKASQFDVPRGEHGEFQKIEENSIIYRHGDARYLPHYQTASGFVLAMAQNDLYAEINQKKSFSELFSLGVQKRLIKFNQNKVYEKYEKQLGPNEDQIIDAFKSELMNAGIRALLDENKEKVGRYFMMLHRQELTALTQDTAFFELISTYNEAHGTHLSLDLFKDIDRRIVVVELLKSNNIDFLKNYLPRLINTDIAKMGDREIYDLRDTEVSHYQSIIPKNKINKESLDLKRFLSLAHLDVDDLLAVMKKIASNLNANEALHHRSSLRFLKGANSDLIHKFEMAIFQLDQTTSSLKKNVDKNTEENRLKHILLNIYQDFHQKLEKNNSKRTMKALHENTDLAIESLNTQINRKAF